MLRKAYLEITNVCNLACAFCPGTKRKKKFMSTEEFTILASKLRGYTEYLYFHLMGEPLLHPDLAEFLNIADQLQFKVMLTTNGTLLPSCGETMLRAAALHKVNISLQSFEANRGGELTEYVSACAAFAKDAAEAGKLCEFRLWNRGGQDSLNEEITDILQAFFPQPWGKSRNGYKLRERVWLEHGDKFDWPDLTVGSKGERRFCYGLRDQIGVLCDGTVVPCCLDHEGNIPLGNLLDDSLDDIMSTDRAKSIYEGFSCRQAVEPLCQSCGYSLRFT